MEVRDAGGDVVIYRHSMCWGVYVRDMVGAGEKEIVLIYEWRGEQRSREK